MFGRKLTELRKTKGLSQYELADLLGFSRGQLANYEQGSREPNFETTLKIADFFGVSLDELIKPYIPLGSDTNLFISEEINEEEGLSENTQHFVEKKIRRSKVLEKLYELYQSEPNLRKELAGIINNLLED